MAAHKAHIRDRTIARLLLALTPASFAMGSALVRAKVKGREPAPLRGVSPTFRAKTSFPGL
jgi:hypothetical protein